MRCGWLAMAAVAAVLAASGGARADTYGAMAAGINGDQVGVGAAEDYPTQAAADARAMQECQSQSQNCKIVSQFSGGSCGYITTVAENGTCYGWGETPITAAAECESGGCGVCFNPIGGCTTGH